MIFTSIAVVGSVPAGSYYDRPDAVRYTSFPQAVAQAPAGALIVVMPGVHANGGVTIDKKLTIIGAGVSPDDAILRASTANAITLGHNAELTLEHLRFEAWWSGGWDSLFVLPGGVTTVQLFANRCVFYGVSNSGLNQGFFSFSSSSGVSTGAANRLQFQHCTLHRGYSQFTRQGLSSIALMNCYLPNAFFEECAGSLHVNDYVQVPTPGYGANYGWRYQDGVDKSQRAIDLQNNLPVTATLFDWDAPQLFVKIDTDADHAWHSVVRRGMRYGLYYISRDNRCPPIIHGPYIAE